MKTLIANIRHAARNRETLTIGGGQFNAEELLLFTEALESLKGVAWCLSWHEQKHGVGMDAKMLEEARAVLAKAEDYV